MVVVVVVVVFIQDAQRGRRQRSFVSGSSWLHQKRILEIFLEAALSLELKDQSQNYRETPERQQFLLNAPRTNPERAPKCYREAAHQYWCNHSAVQPLSAWHHYTIDSLHLTIPECRGRRSNAQKRRIRGGCSHRGHPGATRSISSSRGVHGARNRRRSRGRSKASGGSSISISSSHGGSCRAVQLLLCSPKAITATTVPTRTAVTATNAEAITNPPITSRNPTGARPQSRHQASPSQGALHTKTTSTMKPPCSVSTHIAAVSV